MNHICNKVADKNRTAWQKVLKSELLIFFVRENNAYELQILYQTYFSRTYLRRIRNPNLIPLENVLHLER